MGIISEMSKTLFRGDSPYNYADMSYGDNGYPHTFKNPSLVSAVLDVTNCSFWLEIGSMVGGSAIKTANVIKEKGISAGVVCVDPFTGDAFMWKENNNLINKRKWSFLQLKDCRPTIYNRFIANVAKSGVSDIVLPIPCTSTVGIRLIDTLYKEKRISSKPEVIYLDSAHEADETFVELKKSWELLKDGGILFGDDWKWDSVRNDVIKAFSNSSVSNQTLFDKLISIMPPTDRVGPILLYTHNINNEINTHWLLCK